MSRFEIDLNDNADRISKQITIEIKAYLRMVFDKELTPGDFAWVLSQVKRSYLEGAKFSAQEFTK